MRKGSIADAIDDRRSGPERSASSRQTGRLLTKVGLAAGRRVLARRRGVRDRGPVPAPRLPAPPGHGRGRTRHVPLAPRPLRSRVGLHARPVGRRRPRLRRPTCATATCSCGRVPTTIRSGTCRRGCATGSKTASRSSIAKSVLGLLDAGVSRGRHRAHRRRVRHAYRGAGWGAGLTVLVAMANLFPHLDADDRALALVHGLAFVARDTRQPRAALRGRPADDARRSRSPASPAGTGASSTRAPATRPSARCETALDRPAPSRARSRR